LIVPDNIIGNSQPGFTTCLGCQNSLRTITRFGIADHQALYLRFRSTIYNKNSVNELGKF